jgi:dihydropteroate synthase
MIALARESKVNMIAMHNMGIPADRSVTIPVEANPVEELKKWLTQKIERWGHEGLDLDKIIFDPGIGFGKTASQSVQLLKNLREFHAFGLRLLVGHSRKSFMSLFTDQKPAQRDAETLGVSLKLFESGVDIIRVHDVSTHLRAFRAWNHT